MNIAVYLGSTSGNKDEFSFAARSFVKLTEPPYTEPYVRWCEGSGKLFNFPSYSIVLMVNRPCGAIVIIF